MAKHDTKKGAVGRKSVGKRALSLFMALVMSLSLVQITAFAADGSGLTKEQEANKAAQVKNADNNGVTTPEDGKGKVTMEKTAAVTDEEGKFLMTLKVTTKDEIKQVTEEQEPTIDVVLLIDNSWSMSDDSSRLTDAKDAATAFVSKFLDKAYSNRRVAAYTFGKDVYEVSGLTKDANALKGEIENINARYEGTNMQIALKKARDVLSGSEAEYKYVILLSDGAPSFCYEGKKGTKTNVTQDEIVAETWRAERREYTYRQNYVYTDFNYKSWHGNGTYTDTDMLYNTVSEAWLLKAAGVEVYGVGISLGNDHEGRYTMHNVVTLDGSVPPYAGHYIDCQEGSGSSLATKLNKAFDAIVKNITVKTNAWKVTDKMGEAVSFDGFVEADKDGNLSVVNGANVGAVLDAAGDSFVWDLKALATNVEIVGTGENARYIYTLQYYVTLKDEYRNGVDHDANEQATLSFSFEDDLNEDGVQNLYDADFAVPQVKGYKADLSFTKVAHENGGKTPLAGATFTLTKAPTADSQYINGYRTFAAQSMPETVSTELGEVKFTGIPSGYTYILEETNAPDGYQKSGPWTVTVAYGEVTVTKDGKEVTLDTVENTLDPQPKDITITKIWQAPAGTEFPESITLNLMRKADGSSAAPTKVATITASESRATIALEDGIIGISVKSANNWVYTITAPSVDVETGAKWTYSVTEDAVSGYTSSANGLTVTNTITEKTSFTVTKTWILPAGETAPEVQVTLSGNGSTSDAVTLNKANDWTYTWGNLDRYDSKGQEIRYTVSEAEIPGGYTQSKIQYSGNQATITNTVSAQTTDYTVNKTWKDGNGEGRPENIQVQLLKNGKAVETVTIAPDKDGKWSYTWEDLPVYDFTYEDETLKSVTRNAYTVKEVKVPGYASSVSNNTITNTRTGVIDQLKATKVWNDKDYSFDHDEVTFMLQRSTDGTNYTTVDTKETVNKEAVWTNFAKYDENGYAYTYKVVEEAVAGYDTAYAPANGVFDANGTVTVTNTLKDIKDNETEVTVNKTWLGEATENVTFYLYQNKQGETVGEEQRPFKTETLTKGDTSLTFTNLPKQYRVQNEDGSIGEADYVYTVVEANGQNFEQVGKATVSEDRLTWSFTNRNTETTSFTVNKVWKDLDDSARGEAVITLYRDANGAKDEESTWTWTVVSDSSYTFADLEKYDERGNLYTYYVEETTVPAGYTSSVSEDGHTITNTLNQANINKVIQKVWVDGGKANEDRPDITVNLLRDNEKIAEVTVKNDGTVVAPKGYTVVVNTDAEDRWTITFQGLPQYNEARTAKYVYTVSEEPVAGYQITYGTDTITNTQSQTELGYTLTKYWVDGNNENRTRPEKLVFELTAIANGKNVASVDGKSIPSTVTLTAKNAVENQPSTWSTNLELPGLSDERYPISYTLTEVVPAGYTSENLTVGTSFAFRNTLTQDNSISVTANKVWENSYEGFLTDEQKPVDVDSVDVGLYRKSGSGNFTLVEGSIRKMTKADGWTITYSDLPKYDANGFIYQYQVFEGSYTTDAAGQRAWIRAESTISFNGRTYEVSYDGNTITNTFEAPAQYYYTVVGNYTTYLDGQEVTSASETGVVLVGITGLTEITDVTVDAMKYVGHKGATFQYIGGSIQAGKGEVKDFTDAQVTVKVEKSNVLYTITLNYERRTSTPYTPSTSYTVTVNYLDKDSGAVIHEKYSTTQREYTAYDVTAQDKIAIEGYTYVETTGDALTGTLNGNKVINVYYTKDSDIDDGDTPADPGSDIGDDDVPTTPAQPPKTGDSMGLWIAAAMVSGMGLVWISLSGKKREEEV